LSTRKSATMLAFGFSSGLPYALLIGTLNAWLGEAKINLATIGVLSWIGLSLQLQVPVVAAGRPLAKLPGSSGSGGARAGSCCARRS
jgi:hypothetical protein